MTTISEIELAIERLKPEELRALRKWFAERDAGQWDREFEADVAAGAPICEAPSHNPIPATGQKP